MNNINEFQLACRRTVNFENDKLENYALGIAGEAGEIADHIKKQLYQGHTWNSDELIVEIGDLLWYLSNLAYKANRDMSECLDAVLSKLQKRYPEGFEEDRSRNRVE